MHVSSDIGQFKKGKLAGPYPTVPTLPYSTLAPVSFGSHRLCPSAPPKIFSLPLCCRNRPSRNLLERGVRG